MLWLRSITITTPKSPASAAFTGVTDRWSTGLPFSLTYMRGTLTRTPGGTLSTNAREGNLAAPPIDPLSEAAVALTANSARSAEVIAPT